MVGLNAEWRRKLPSNSGRQRVNINGAVNIDPLEVEVDFTGSVNSESMKRFMAQLIAKNPSQND
jgi:hypothetical protein